MRLLFLLFLLLPGLASAAASNVFSSPRDTVQLVSATNAADGGKTTLGLEFKLAPGWHIYWSNPGDAGLAPQIALDAPAVAKSLLFPPPELLIQGPVGDYVLSGNFLLPFSASGVGDSVAANASWLVCSDICVPEHARFVLALTGGVSAEAGLFAAPIIVASPFAARIAPDGKLLVAGLTAAQVKVARFFPYQPDEIVNRADQILSFDSDGMVLHLVTAPGFDSGAHLAGVLELTDPEGNMQALAVDAVPGAVAVTPIWVWLGLAFLGGLILNLMPCVFPILAMKALAIARLGGHAAARVRREAIGYTAGVLCAFLLLGVALLLFRAAGENIGWGFQFQSPMFVGVIAVLIFGIGLNLAGVFEIPGWGNFGNALAGRGNFFTGLLAVVVATPCTAPFMGGAVAAALAAPAPVALGIFLALGLGLAAPFLLLAAVPAVAAVFPRPGAWMKILQRALSVPMFATVIWLGWVFLHETGAEAAPLTLPGAENFSSARLAALRSKNQPVFVDMTAAWCVTCLVNERSSLTAPRVRAAFAAAHVQVLVGDWTQRDADISAFLQANHRDGVPLYVFFPAAGAPVTLPQVLTPGIVVSAITAAPPQFAQTPAPGG
jgi:thiol:disulfide interchange protein DsbD